MDIQFVAQWMQASLEKDGCLYQEDVVDFLVKANHEILLRENSDGNLVLNKALLGKFKKLNEECVVWVKPGRYWRFRVKEDDHGRDARG